MNTNNKHSPDMILSMQKKCLGRILIRGAKSAPIKSAPRCTAITKPKYPIGIFSCSKYKGTRVNSKSVPPLKKASMKIISEANFDSLNASTDSNRRSFSFSCSLED